MKLGYARVSTTDQDLAIQRTRLHEAGCEKLFEEEISGARKKRPVLERLLSELRADDVSTFAKSVSIPHPSFATNPSRNR